MTTTEFDAPITLNDGSNGRLHPHNYDGRYHGTCIVATCLGNSLNIPPSRWKSHRYSPYITTWKLPPGSSRLTYRRCILPQHRPCPKQYSATLGCYVGVSPPGTADGASDHWPTWVFKHDPAPVTKIIDRTLARFKYQYDATQVPGAWYGERWRHHR